MRAVKASVLTARHCPKIKIQTEFPCLLHKDLCLVYLWHANIVCNFSSRGQSSWKGTCQNDRVNTEKSPSFFPQVIFNSTLSWGEETEHDLWLQTSDFWHWACKHQHHRLGENELCLVSFEDNVRSYFSKEVICKGWFLPQTLLTAEADNFVCAPLPEENHLSGQLSALCACQKLSKRCWLQCLCLGQGECLKRLFLRTLSIFLTWADG